MQCLDVSISIPGELVRDANFGATLLEILGVETSQAPDPRQFWCKLKFEVQLGSVAVNPHCT